MSQNNSSFHDGFSSAPRSTRNRNQPKVYKRPESNRRLTLHELRLFGGFSLTIKEGKTLRTIDLRDQAKEFIGILTIQHDREVAREWLSGVMWPSASNAKPRQSLYTLWSYVTRELGGIDGESCCIAKTRNTIKLETAGAYVDVVELEKACDAIMRGNLSKPYDLLTSIQDIYRGEFLPGFENQEIVAARNTWKNRLTAALCSVAQQLAKRDDHASSLLFLEFAEQIDPFDEYVCFLQADILRQTHLHFKAMERINRFQKRAITKYASGGSGRLVSLYETILQEVQ